MPSSKKHRGQVARLKTFLSIYILEDKNLDQQEAENQAKTEATSTPEEQTAETTKTSESPEAQATVEAPSIQASGAHDDFDWSVDKKNVSGYTEAETKEYDVFYEQSFSTINDGEIKTAVVQALTETDAVVDIGYKSDGLISLNEFRDLDEVNVGDEVEVFVVEKENRDGHLVLSRKQARAYRAWEKIVNFYKTGEVTSGLITHKTKGGLIVDIFGMETFLPGSQIDVKPVTDYDQFVGKTMEFKVVKINEEIRNAVVSHKALIESDIEAQRAEIMGKLEKGQVLEGTVKNVTDFGAFIDLGGIDGLLYITDISWGRIKHPSEVLENGQSLNVVILDFDDDKKRISLGLKQLTDQPWEKLPEEIQEGNVVKGKVVNIEDYGAFIEIEPGIEGLVHVSEITWSNQPINAKEYFTEGNDYEAKIVSIDKEEKKMSLSIKAMSEDPWDKIEVEFAEGTRHKGEVKNLTPYGVFVEFNEGIGGMIHISDLSWVKRYNHPSDFTKVGDELEVIVLNVDTETRKLSLGHKQLEDDPWDTFESTFPMGTVHEGLLIRKEDKGGIVQLQYGLEAFAPTRHLRKEDEKSVAADETAQFMIIEFDRNEKRILVSHSKTWEAEKEMEKEAGRQEKRAQGEYTKKSMKSMQSKIEKATLGDLDVLANLKKKMEGEEKEGDS